LETHGLTMLPLRPQLRTERLTPERFEVSMDVKEFNRET